MIAPACPIVFPGGAEKPAMYARTGFVIVSEMTQNDALIIPLMLTALIADLVSKLVVPHGVYHGIASAMHGSSRSAGADGSAPPR